MAPVSENNQNNKIKALRLWWKWKPVMKRDWQRSHYILAWILKCPQKKNIKNTDLYYDTVTVKPKTRSENCTDFQEWQIRTGIHTHARTHTHHTTPPFGVPTNFYWLDLFFLVFNRSITVHWYNSIMICSLLSLPPFSLFYSPTLFFSPLSPSLGDNISLIYMAVKDLIKDGILDLSPFWSLTSISVNLTAPNTCCCLFCKTSLHYFSKLAKDIWHWQFQWPLKRTNSPFD